MENDNKVVRSLWIYGDLSNNEILGISSYLYHGHEFYLYSYNPILNPPAGVTIKDANDIIPESFIFKDSHGSLAAFSDWFRFKLLYDYGGWWVDIDTVCLQPLNLLQPYCFSSEYDNKGSLWLNATCIKSKPKAEFLKDCLDFIDKKGSKEVSFGDYGLTLFRQKMAKYEYNDYQQSAITFCPINWFDIAKLITKTPYSFSMQTYTIHLWNEIWRRGYLDKNAIYHPESIYERLKSKYIQNYNL